MKNFIAYVKANKASFIKSVMIIGGTAVGLVMTGNLMAKGVAADGSGATGDISE